MNLLLPTEVTCPWCGETFELVIDTSQGDQQMVEDCTVCCRPMQLQINCEPGEVISVDISS